MLSLSQIWSGGAFNHSLSNYFLVFSLPLLPQTPSQLFIEGKLVPFSEEWYLETKILVIGVMIVTEMSVVCSKVTWLVLSLCLCLSHTLRLSFNVLILIWNTVLIAVSDYILFQDSHKLDEISVLLLSPSPKRLPLSLTKLILKNVFGCRYTELWH